MYRKKSFLEVKVVPELPLPPQEVDDVESFHPEHSEKMAMPCLDTATPVVSHKSPAIPVATLGLSWIQSIEDLMRMLLANLSQLCTLHPFLIVCVCCSIVSLTPLMSGRDFGLAQSSLSMSLQSGQLLTVVVACLTLTVPLWLDLSLDVATKVINTSYVLNWSEWTCRLLLQMVLVLPMIVVFSRPTGNNLGMVFISLVFLQTTVWAAVCLWQLNHHSQTIWTASRVTAILIMFTASYILDLANLSASSMALTVISSILRFACIAIFFVLFIIHNSKTTFRLIFDFAHKEYTTFILGATGSLAFLCYFLQPFFTPGASVANCTVTSLTWYFILLSAFILLTTALPGRSARYEALQLRDNLEMKRTFVRYVSHEVRTPLNTICMGLELIEAELIRQGAKPDTIDTLSQLKESALVAVETLSDLLLYEKIEAGIMALELSYVFPNPFLHRACQSFQIQARAMGVQLNVHSTAQYTASPLLNLNLHIDEKKLSQVIRNFVSNALKFTPAGGQVDVDMTLILPSHHLTSKCVRIQVKDSGYGIALENQHKIFNEIVQFNANSQQGGGGSGLGLWISKKIVELHGGKVGLHSEGEGRGCTFFLDLPLHEPPTNQRHALTSEMLRPSHHELLDRLSPLLTMNQTPRRRSTKTSFPPGIRRPSLHTLSNSRRPSLQTLSRLSICEDFKMPVILLDDPTSDKYRVLVCDDAALNRKVVTRCLQDKGHHCIEAENGLAAVEIFGDGVERANIDVVLIDNNMPVMMGTVATRRIRELGFKGFIIGCTGNALPSDTADFLAHGADMVLIKPMNVKQFEHAMVELVASRQLKNAIASINKSSELSKI